MGSDIWLTPRCFAWEKSPQVLRIVATVLGGMVLGGAAGWLIPRRTQLTISGKQAAGRKLCIDCSALLPGLRLWLGPSLP